MKCVVAAFALLSALGSYAAEVPQTGIAITALDVKVAEDTLKLSEVSLYVAIYDRKDLEDTSLDKAVTDARLGFYCLTKDRSLPQFPDTLDCRPDPGVETSNTLRFSIHAPIPQLSAPADRSELLKDDYVPEWTHPVILYVEWDAGYSRIFGSYKVPAGKLNFLYGDSEGIVFDANIGRNYIPVDVISQPN